MKDDENTVQETSVVRAEDISLDDVQISEQLYASAGLDPVVDAGLKDYDEKIKKENKLLNKMLGPREGDIRGYGEAVARRVAYAVYNLMNHQYGGKMGNLRDYIMNLEDERNRANTRYDELMGRVIGILGEEYRQLRTDSREFMEKLNSTLGEDIKASKIDQKSLAESLANIDGLRKQIADLEKTRQELVDKHTSEVNGLKEKHAADIKEAKEKHESQSATARAEYREEIRELKNEAKETQKSHIQEIKTLNERISALEEEVGKLTGERDGLTADLAKLRQEHAALNESVQNLPASVPYQEIGDRVGDEAFTFILKDSKVPDAVIEGVGKFIDFRKYLKMAAGQAAEQAAETAREQLQGNEKQA